MSIGISLHIGLNKVDCKAYDGHWNGRLNSSANNAQAMAQIAYQQGFSKIETLLDIQATSENVTHEIRRAAAQLKSGDLFFISFAGHGGSVEDISGDEPDLMDEAWCLYDGFFIDDRLFDLWLQFSEGVKIVLVSDSCFSGGMDRDQISNQQQIEYIRRKKQIEAARAKQIIIEEQLCATVRLFSACREREHAENGREYTKFTANLLNVWDNGKFKGDYHLFARQLAKDRTFSNTPQHLTIGPKNNGFDADTPFTI